MKKREYRDYPHDIVNSVSDIEDFVEGVGDLFVRFRHAEHTEGEATSDGKVIIHYDENGRIVAVEIAGVAAQ